MVWYIHDSDDKDAVSNRSGVLQKCHQRSLTGEVFPSLSHLVCRICPSYCRNAVIMIVATLEAVRYDALGATPSDAVVLSPGFVGMFNQPVCSGAIPR
nr:hypothetical protein CFP56_00713 [Quercus suber]